MVKKWGYYNMKHLKKFENKEVLKLTYVEFYLDDDSDYVLALYVNGELLTYGDQDHDGIVELMRGVEIGLKYYSKIDVKREKCNNEEYCEKICNSVVTPPKTLDELEVIINGTKMGLL